MKAKLIIALLFICAVVLADSMIITVRQDATDHDKELADSMVQGNFDPLYSFLSTNSVVQIYKKKGSPDSIWLVGDWDVEGRKMSFKADNATAWISSHSAEFDNPNNVKAIKKLDSKLWTKLGVQK